MASQPHSRRDVSRRDVLKRGAVALGGSAALLGVTAAESQNGQAPAVLTGTQTGRTFRGLVRHDTTLFYNTTFAPNLTGWQTSSAYMNPRVFRLAGEFAF